MAPSWETVELAPKRLVERPPVWLPEPDGFLSPLYPQDRIPPCQGGYISVQYQAVTQTVVQGHSFQRVDSLHAETMHGNYFWSPSSRAGHTSFMLFVVMCGHLRTAVVTPVSSQGTVQLHLPARE